MYTVPEYTDRTGKPIEVGQTIRLANNDTPSRGVRVIEGEVQKLYPFGSALIRLADHVTPYNAEVKDDRIGRALVCRKPGDVFTVGLPMDSFGHPADAERKKTHWVEVIQDAPQAKIAAPSVKRSGLRP